MVFGLTRKENRVPDLSRYDYYYQNKQDYNKSSQLSADAAYAASSAQSSPPPPIAYTNSNQLRSSTPSTVNRRSRRNTVINNNNNNNRNSNITSRNNVRKANSMVNYSSNPLRKQQQLQQQPQLPHSNSTRSVRNSAIPNTKRITNVNPVSKTPQKRQSVRKNSTTRKISSNNNTTTNAVTNRNSNKTYSLKSQISFDSPRTKKNINTNTDTDTDTDTNTNNIPTKKIINNNTRRINSLTTATTSQKQLQNNHQRRTNSLTLSKKQQENNSSSRTNSITIKTTKVLDPSGRTKSITKKTIKKIDGNEYIIETTTTTTTTTKKKKKPNNNYHFDHFSDNFVDDYNEDLIEELNNNNSNQLDDEDDIDQSFLDPRIENIILANDSTSPQIQEIPEEDEDEDIIELSENNNDQEYYDDYVENEDHDDESEVDYIEEEENPEEQVEQIDNKIDEFVSNNFTYDYDNPYLDDINESPTLTPSESTNPAQFEWKIQTPYSELQTPKRIKTSGSLVKLDETSSMSKFDDALDYIPTKSITTTKDQHPTSPMEKLTSPNRFKATKIISTPTKISNTTTVEGYNNNNKNNNVDYPLNKRKSKGINKEKTTVINTPTATAPPPPPPPPSQASLTAHMKNKTPRSASFSIPKAPSSQNSNQKTKQPLTEEEMYAHALKAAEKIVYKDRIASPISQQSGKGKTSNMGQRMTLRSPSDNNNNTNTNNQALMDIMNSPPHPSQPPPKNKLAALFHKTKSHSRNSSIDQPTIVTTQPPVVVQSHTSPRTSNNSMQRNIPSVNTTSEETNNKTMKKKKKPLSDEEMYAQALKITRKRYLDSHGIVEPDQDNGSSHEDNISHSNKTIARGNVPEQSSTITHGIITASRPNEPEFEETTSSTIMEQPQPITPPTTSSNSATPPTTAAVLPQSTTSKPSTKNKSKFHDLMDKVVQFSVENSGYQPPREEKLKMKQSERQNEEQLIHDQVISSIQNPTIPTQKVNSINNTIGPADGHEQPQQGGINEEELGNTIMPLNVPLTNPAATDSVSSFQKTKSESKSMFTMNSKKSNKKSNNNDIAIDDTTKIIKVNTDGSNGTIKKKSVFKKLFNRH
ncbi:Msc3p NDAI_0E03420 [Naumovozyma dairenensis CBS 421]|uniref:Uncharacterized protein n=1 Tax=Naumovozyma dairenensis (strain ATCC 10597 / BCRC 20456 / CBS 421 / NBRC 0211 / NRRL Y-12639) TaxID=1071378 RepID=G0WBN9_NAUDC|nr:hypothetical protein NDAI_0E03420 [Naumovozyma dairenensis CBS 421]CCD25159.1 hypothetical protein NDAI_0E03420 [Naumovozyma dairenensis CBS 421]